MQTIIYIYRLAVCSCDYYVRMLHINFYLCSSLYTCACKTFTPSIYFKKVRQYNYRLWRMVQCVHPSQMSDKCGYFYNSCTDSIRINPLSPSQWTIFCVGKAVHVAMRVIIPCFYMTFGKLESVFSYNYDYCICTVGSVLPPITPSPSAHYLLNILYDVILGYWMAQLTQVNHVTEEVRIWSLRCMHA